ncbi:MAG: histidine kinase [Bacteroidetes bacterium]|nr:histidine kinase [Bacteroidota bacterium]
MSKSSRVLFHVFVWIAIILLFMFLVGNGKLEYKTVVVIVYFGLINIVIFYANYLFILPTFLNRKKYGWCALIMIALVLISSFIKCGLAYYYYDLIIIRDPGKYVMTFWDYFMSTVLIGSLFIFLSTVLKFVSDWFLNEKIKTKLENEKLFAELAFLKSQINPHFLFNSLNNIYSLAYQKSDKTPEAILKLSEIMRYMLNESNEDKVSLADEIRYLGNYIELQKLRFKDESYISFLITGEIKDQKITPLILISFVENAFKHGIATDKQAPINIFLNIEPERIFFKTTNKKNNQNKDEAGGIGLQNVQRRLELLYKDNFVFNIEDKNEMYNCELGLNL